MGDIKGAGERHASSAGADKSRPPSNLTEAYYLTATVITINIKDGKKENCVRQQPVSEDPVLGGAVVARGTLSPTSSPLTQRSRAARAMGSHCSLQQKAAQWVSGLWGSSAQGCAHSTWRCAQRNPQHAATAWGG